jgi:SAM-dependent methyltransferase
MDLKEIDILEDQIGTHWYYRSKAKAMSNLIGQTRMSTILDVGSGSGFFAKHLLLQTSAKEAWCVDPSYDRDSNAVEAGKDLHFRRSIGFVEADMVLLMDVLEHVDDDVGLLSEYVGKVPAGASFLISVPAFQFLWSAHDDFLEHRRRYTLRELENVVRKSGLAVTRGAYYFGSVFPIAGSIRLADNMLRRASREPRSQMKRHHPLVNGVLATLCRAELPFMKANRLVGLSAFCLAHRGSE